MLRIYICFLMLWLNGCTQEAPQYSDGHLTILVEQGKAWKHDFPLFMGIKTRNTPQIAIWAEDREGNYLSTIYVTSRIATQNWRMAKGNRRKEALPHWSYSRGVEYEDGLYLPTKKEPLADGISGATPKGSFDVQWEPQKGQEQFIIKIEVNHSTDFNDYYPKTAIEGEKNYSGGKEGSGQPALVYAATIDLAETQTTYEAKLIGHSSPDGSDGSINPDISKLTTALDIVKNIRIEINGSY